MRCLNEWIARRANAEDECSGHFWEGRFKSQALLDDGALLACMSYVDLNPIRAGIAMGLEESDFTSIQARLELGLSPPLAPLKNDGSRVRYVRKLPISLRDYVDLLEWTGRTLARQKFGTIARPPPSLLLQTGLETEAWLPSIAEWSLQLGAIVGHDDRGQRVAAMRGQRWYKGKRWAKRMYRRAQ